MTGLSRVSRWIAPCLLALAALAAPVASHAQNVTSGQDLYESFCLSCHGSPPVGGPERGAANDPNFIRSAFSRVPAMTFLEFLSNAQLADLAAYIAVVLGVTPPPPPEQTQNYTALWWNAAESGWGVNFSHQENLVFGTLFTYDATGAPLWLVMPAGAAQPGGTAFSGTLFRTTGSPFNASPFAGATASSVGTMAVTFGSGNTASLNYTFNGVAVTKTVVRQPVGTRRAACVPTSGSRASLTNYQDLWYNASESGWGINITQELTSAGETIFATLFTYDATGKGLWLVLADGARQADGSFSGTLFQTTGSAFNANPFAGATASAVGTMRLRFTSGEAGSLSYTYNGVSVTKAITRQVIRNPVGLPACTS